MTTQQDLKPRTVYPADGRVAFDGSAPMGRIVTLTAEQYETLYLTPKDVVSHTAVTSTFGNATGVGTIGLLLVVLPWSLGQCKLAGTDTTSYIILAPALIFCGFVLSISAGIMCFIQGLSFPMYVNFTYGGFSGLLWYLNAPVAELLVTQGGLLSGGTLDGAEAYILAAGSKEFTGSMILVLIPFAIMSCM